MPLAVDHKVFQGSIPSYQLIVRYVLVNHQIILRFWYQASEVLLHKVRKMTILLTKGVLFLFLVGKVPPIKIFSQMLLWYHLHQKQLVFKPIRNYWELSKERLPVAKQIMERYLIKAPPPSNSSPIINPHDSPSLINFSKPF